MILSSADCFTVVIYVGEHRLAPPRDGYRRRLRKAYIGDHRIHFLVESGGDYCTLHHQSCRS